MKFVQAQFALKYEPQIKIRRAANDIEDFLQHYYGPPQTMPLPDEFAPEAPRIILYDNGNKACGGKNDRSGENGEVYCGKAEASWADSKAAGGCGGTYR